MNLKLKARLAATGLKQYHIADRIGIPEIRLSRLVYQRLNPTQQEISRLSEVLSSSPEELGFEATEMPAGVKSQRLTP